MPFALTNSEYSNLLQALQSLVPQAQINIIKPLRSVEKFMDFYTYKLHDGKEKQYLPLFIRPSKDLMTNLMFNAHEFALAAKRLSFDDIPKKLSPQERLEYWCKAASRANLELESNYHGWMYTYVSHEASKTKYPNPDPFIVKILSEHQARRSADLNTIGAYTYPSTCWQDQHLLGGVSLDYCLSCIADPETATCELLEIDLAYAEKQPWNVFLYFPLGNFNHCPAPNVLVQLMYRWASFGVVPAIIADNEVDLYVEHPEKISNPEILNIAREMYAIAPDLIDQGEIFSLGQLADILRKSKVWHIEWR